MITYEEVHRNYVKVFLEGKEVGHILIVAGGFQYRTKRNKGMSHSGDVLPSIDHVKYSLEHE